MSPRESCGRSSLYPLSHFSVCARTSFKVHGSDLALVAEGGTRTPNRGKLLKIKGLGLPKGGLEPPRVTSHAPQTCASTSSATSAHSGRLSKNSQSVWIVSRYFFGVAVCVSVGDGD